MKPIRRGTQALALVAASVGFPACRDGEDDEDKQAAATPKKVAVTATEAAKQSRLSVSTSVPAGLVTVELTNTGRGGARRRKFLPRTYEEAK